VSLVNPSGGKGSHLSELHDVARACGVEEIHIHAESTAQAIQVVVDAFRQLRSRGIPAPKQLLFVRLDDADTIAMYRDTDDSLSINVTSGFWTSPSTQMVTVASGGYLVSAEPLAIVYHEIGHARHRRSYRFGWHWWMASSRRLRNHERQVAMLVSRYAAEDTGEFVAEVFAGRMLGIEFDDEVLSLYRKLRGPME
jgi:hypothetical protein